MPPSPVVKWLEREGAQHDVVAWASSHANDWRTFWAECPRGDWLLAIAARMDLPRERLVLAAVRAARSGFDAATGGPVDATCGLDLAEAWARGEVDLERCRAEAERLLALSPPDPAQAALVAAAAMCLLAIDDPGAASAAAANAAQAEVFGSADCALLSLFAYAARRTADSVREVLPASAIDQRFPRDPGPG